MRARVERLQQKLKEADLDAILVGQAENRYYLSGFRGSEGWLVITRRHAYLCTDFRYIEQARGQAPGFEVVRYQRPFTVGLSQVIVSAGVTRVGFEEEYLPYQIYRRLVEDIGGVEWIPVTGIVESMRLQKDEQEVAAIRRGAALDDMAFEYILSFVKPGRQEREVALELELFARRRGGEKASFEIIVSSGPRSALPHGVASNKVLKAGEFLLMDFGTVIDGYHSDFTRTIFLGEPGPKQLSVYRAVQEAQAAAVQAIAPGRSAGEVDAVARRIIEAHGYGDYFGHGLGHGVGLSVHEEPRLAPNEDVVLRPGMIITVEPGIYIPGWGGVRIEDLVLVTETGHEVLNRSPRHLITI